MEKPLSPELLHKMNAYRRAANYLSVGQIYLLANPLLKAPLKLDHVKPRLLGHWGTTPGLNFIYVHLSDQKERVSMRCGLACKKPSSRFSRLGLENAIGRRRELISAKISDALASWSDLTTSWAKFREQVSYKSRHSSRVCRL